MTSIEWTDRTWNPVRGCSRVSEGCRHCYAERMAARFETATFKPSKLRPFGAGPFAGFTKGGKWTGRVELVPEKLDEPLHWRKPARIFVNSMSDLFHEALSDEAIAAVFGVMAAAPQHTFQILTKRPKRMHEWFVGWLAGMVGRSRNVYPDDTPAWVALHLVTNRARHFGAPGTVQASGDGWPLPNVWLGVSVEDQATAAARIPLLLQTPAAKRFISYEPALGPLEMLPSWLAGYDYSGGLKHSAPRLDWVIVGGESGPGARPFDVSSARSVVRQCREAGVACFVKQLGAVWARSRRVKSVLASDAKGGSPEWWPEDLRVREWPA